MLRPPVETVIPPFLMGGLPGAFFALLATFLLVSICIPQFYKQTRKAFFYTMVLGATLSLFLPIPQSAYGILGRITKTVNSDTLDAAMSGRLVIWLNAFDIFKEKPLFGHGLVQYQHLVKKLTPSTPEHVHNILMEALISFGLIGTLALIYLLGKILFTAFVRLRAHPADCNVPMLLIATSLLLHGFVSGTYFHMHSMITLGIALGFLLKIEEPHQSQKH